MMLLVIWMLLILCVPLFESTLVKEQTMLSSDKCNDAIQKSIVNKMELLKSEIVNLKYRLNTLNIIIDQLFGELKVAIADIPSQNISTTTTATERSCSSSTDKQCDAVETTKPIQPKQSNSNNSIPSLSLPSNCQGRQNGTHLIQIPNSKLGPFHVYCIEDPQSDAAASWILIQRRRNGNVDFYRNWNDYQRGFGYLQDDYFIGLEKLHALTRFTLHELWIEMQGFDNETLWARYSSFAIGDNSESYALNVLGNYTGNAGDSLEYHAGQKFTTNDVDNDMNEDNNCAKTSVGGWWYKDCYESNLNGKYYEQSYSLINKNPTSSRIIWKTWHQYSPLKYVHMAIRPLNVDNKPQAKYK